jgi:hypothetical protein
VILVAFWVILADVAICSIYSNFKHSLNKVLNHRFSDLISPSKFSDSEYVHQSHGGLKCLRYRIELETYFDEMTLREKVRLFLRNLHISLTIYSSQRSESTCALTQTFETPHPRVLKIDPPRCYHGVSSSNRRDDFCPDHARIAASVSKVAEICWHSPPTALGRYKAVAPLKIPRGAEWFALTAALLICLSSLILKRLSWRTAKMKTFPEHAHAGLGVRK